MAGPEWLEIEIACAARSVQYIGRLRVPRGTTLRGALERSRLTEEFPEIRLDQWRVGIFGQLRAMDDILSGGDRIEIYPPLLWDPKDARWQRAREARANRRRGRGRDEPPVLVS